MIILEGPDGSGKTTLAQELVSRFKLIYEHTGPPDTSGDTLFKVYQQMIRNAPRNTVFDRLFHGEYVYGPLLRGGSKIDSVELKWLEFEAAVKGTLVIWCKADESQLIARGDPIYQKVAAKDLLRGYDLLRETTRLPSIPYNSSTTSVGAFIDSLQMAHPKVKEAFGWATQRSV